jgi:isopentenyl diphosphate isomerase/L-lactate dehydrogenase-like FMN-dependent dehydrogenase
MGTGTFTRRKALGNLGFLIAGSSLAQAKALTGETPKLPIRLAPVDEVDDVPRFEDEAKKRLSKTLFASIAGSEREGFDRMTLRPNYMVDTMKMDLSIELFGDKLAAPILVGATPQQKRFDPGGEVATARGASAAKTLLVISSQSSMPPDQIAAQATTGFWYQVSPDEDVKSVQTQMRQAIKAGCKAICIAIAPGTGSAPPRPDWSAIKQLRQGISVPVLVKGIMTPEDAKAAVQEGIQGIIVSCNRVPAPAGRPTAIEMLPSIADAVQGKVAVLIDGSVRWGTDVFKALALGANAVLVGRPAMWGLAAYGDAGVDTVVELLQSDLARIMAACGNVNPASIVRTQVRIHAQPREQYERKG